MTGVNAVTLRAWERRYGLIRPKRTPKGHRLYTQAHVDLIRRVLALTSRGVPIGQVREALEAEAAPAQEAPASGPWQAYRRRMAAAIAGFDEPALESVYEEALALHPIDRVTRLLLLPLLEELGTRWQKVAGGIAEEHFFSAYLRNKLGARFHHRRPLAAGPAILAACAPGEQHEIGLLLFALAAHEAGIRVVFLGADVPFAEAAAAARRARCHALVISSSGDAEPAALAAALAKLTAVAGVPVYVGGATAVLHEKTIAAAGAVALGERIDAAVQRIAASLAAGKERA